MFPLETPPPQLRRSEWASSLPPDCFVSRGIIPHVSVSEHFVLQGGVVSTSPKPQAGGPPPSRLSATAYSIYSQLPSLSEAVPLSAT